MPGAEAEEQRDTLCSKAQVFLVNEKAKLDKVFEYERYEFVYVESNNGENQGLFAETS